MACLASTQGAPTAPNGPLRFDGRAGERSNPVIPWQGLAISSLCRRQPFTPCYCSFSFPTAHMAADVDCRQQLLSTPCSGDDCFSFQSASQSHSLNADPCPDAMLTKHRRQHQFASRPSSTSESSTSLLESKLRHLLRNIEAHPTQTLVGAKGEQNFPSASLKQSDHRQTPELSATSLGEDGSVVNQQRYVKSLCASYQSHHLPVFRLSQSAVFCCQVQARVTIFPYLKWLSNGLRCIKCTG